MSFCRLVSDVLLEDEDTRVAYGGGTVLLSSLQNGLEAALEHCAALRSDLRKPWCCGRCLPTLVTSSCTVVDKVRLRRPRSLLGLSMFPLLGFLISRTVRLGANSSDSLAVSRARRNWRS